MNVIIVSKSGVLNTPFLVKNDTTAEATFDSIIDDLYKSNKLNDEQYDFLGISIDYGQKLIDLNRMIIPIGIEIFWFVDVEVNKYKNKS